MDTWEGEATPNLVAFADRCTLHGIGRVFSAGPLTLRRVGWAAAVLAALGIVLFQVSERVQYYAGYKHVAAVGKGMGRRLTFPAVSFCNVNPIRRSRLTPDDLRWVGPEMLGVAPSDHSAYGRVLGWPEPEEVSRRAFPGGSFNLREFVERASHGLEEMLLACRFGNRPCSAREFSTSFTRLGKCYTFNSGATSHQLLTTAKGGMGNGLELMLNIQQDEYLPVWGDSDETPYEAGLKVQIHSQGEPPAIDQMGFGVAPGFQTLVACQEQRLFYLPAPWGDCRAHPAGSAFFPNYSAAACRIECETRYLAENCGCRMVHMPGNTNICTPQQYKECADPALDFLVEKDHTFCTCPVPCETVRYSKQLSVVKIPSKASAKYLAKKYNRSEEYITENLLMLDVFFEALNYETIEQKAAYEVAGLLGDIGGQMALFLGASLITILEVFEYLFEVLRDKVSGYYQGRNVVRRGDGDLEYVDLPSGQLPPPPRVPTIHDTAPRTPLAWDPPSRGGYLVTPL